MGETEVLVVDVKEKLREVKKLWIELADIRNLITNTMPAYFNGTKKPITEIKLSSLKCPAGLRIWANSDKEVE